MNKSLVKNILEFYATIIIPLPYFFNIYLIYYFARTLPLPAPVIFLGLLIGLIGLAFWFISFLTLGASKSFGILPRKQKRIKSGIYKYFRHPMYLGVWLTFTGLSIAASAKNGLLFAVFFMLPFLIARAIWEEKYLED